MVIIRRNADGTIANPEVAGTTQSHPALTTKRGMQALQDQAERSYLARERYIGRTNTAISLTKALESKKAAKLKKDLNKLIQGY